MKTNLRISKKQNIRQKMFWLLDRLKGSPIKKNIITVSNVIDSNGSNERNGNLNDILYHAITTTNYYNKFNSNNSIEDFPVVNKNIIRDNLKDFTSNKFDLKKCLKVSTSGSTGAPFTIYHDKGKFFKNIADNIFFSAKSNFDLGSNLVYLKIWPSKLSHKMRYNLTLKNIRPCSVFNLSNHEIVDLIEELNAKKKAISFIGYASAFEKICRHIDNLNYNPIKFKTNSIITTSESLNLYTRRGLKKYFGVSPYSRYSNNENGIIAQQIKSDDLSFRINDSSYFVEIFDLRKDIKLKNGQQGRIIVTDLYNYAVPMIRYDTGDIGTIQLDMNNSPYLSEIYGRKLDLLYDTEGNLVPSHLSAKICNYGNFKQFQLVQKDLKEYEINLNTTIKVDETTMIEEFQSYLGMDAKISVNYVDDIPLLGSGKRREVVNEYYTSN